jgi:hypothetical protein
MLRVHSLVHGMMFGLSDMLDPRLPIKIPEDLRIKIVNLSYDRVDMFQVNSASRGRRRFCNLNEFDHEVTKEVKEFSKECYSAIGINTFQEEPLFGNFIGFNTSASSVHPHKDPRGPNGEWHIRLNFLVQKPFSGGLPILDGIQYEVDEGASWKNIACLWNHETSPVVGEKERIVLSLGALVEESLATKLL